MRSSEAVSKDTCPEPTLRATCRASWSKFVLPDMRSYLGFLYRKASSTVFWPAMTYGGAL